MVVVLSREKKVHSWAATAPSSTKKRRGDNAPGIALIAPIIPVVLLIVLKVPIILGFIIGSFYALFTCGKIKSWGQTCRMVNKDFFDGVVDTAPLVGFLLMLPMFNKAAELCVPYFNALLGGIIPSRKAAKSDPVTALRTE